MGSDQIKFILGRAICLSLPFLALLGCADGNLGINGQDRLNVSAALSGGVDEEDGVPFTGGNDQRLVTYKEPIQAKSLQSLIRHVEITKNDLQIHLLEPSGSLLKLHFTIPEIKADQQKISFKDVKSTTILDRGGYDISGTIERKKSSIEGYYLLNSYSDLIPQKILKDRAEMLSRSYEAVTNLISQGRDSTTRIQSQMQRTKELTNARVMDFTMPGGRSFYQIDLHDDKQDVMRLTGAAKQSGYGMAYPTAVTSTTTDAPQLTDASLLGNTGERDETSFLLTMSDGEHVVHPILEVRAPKEEKVVEKPIPIPPQPPIQSEAYLFNEDQHARTKKVLADWDQNKDNPGLQSVINDVKPIFSDFMQDSMSLRVQLSQLYSSYDVPAASFLKTLTESQMLKRQTLWKSDPIPAKETAVGPFQFHWDTGRQNGLFVYQNLKGQAPALDDERYYLFPSSCADAVSTSVAIDKLVAIDTTFAILAHRLGLKGVSDTLTEIHRVKKPARLAYEKFRELLLNGEYNVTYASTVATGKLSKEDINYVNKFLAYYFLNRNPKQYGLDIPTAGSREVPKNVLVPKKRIQDSKCSVLWTSLQS